MLSLFFSLLVVYSVSERTFPNPCDSSSNANSKFCDTTLSFSERANDLVYNSETNLNDNINIWQSLFNTGAAGVGELSIPSYQWWNEALHGIANSYGVHFGNPIKYATMFPMPIATSSSFNNKLFYDIGNVISTEGRAMYNNDQAGLTFWSPNMNIFRDPRWGRGQETPGEDPFLTSQYAVNFVRGMQGYDYSKNSSVPKYLKSSSCCKHFADYSIETSRDSFNAQVTDYDQNDTYLVSFKWCILDGNASGVMCAYNAINGIPSCADSYTETTLLRNTWGFDGYVTSDCGAVADVFQQHHYTNSWPSTVEVTLSSGMDINCGDVLSQHTVEAYNDGVLNISTIQLAQYHLALVQMRLGFFDDDSNIPYSNLGPNDVCTNSSLDLSLLAARQSIVLLKNNNNKLPIDPTTVKGPIQASGKNSQSEQVMWGNYYGETPFTYSLQDGINAYNNVFNGNSNVYIIGAGLDQSDESEGHDRDSLILPGGQNNEIEQTALTAKQNDPDCIVVLVIISGGCVDISQFVNDSNVDAILWAGYGGMYGGLAIADVIFGTYAPLGRLTQTWYYNSYTQQQSLQNMGIRSNSSDAYGNNPGRGYRYFNGNVIYPFGFGLSYTNFSCSDLKVTDNMFYTSVTNIGTINSGAIVLVYFIPNSSGGSNPYKRLVGYGNIANINVKDTSNIQMEMYKEFYGSKAQVNMEGKYLLGGVCNM